MNNDATEAALGLLGLSPLNAPQSHPQPQQHPHQHVVHPHGPTLTSTTVGIALDPTTTPHVVQSPLPPSLVPLKRKQPSPALPSPSATPLLQRDIKSLASSVHPSPSFSTSLPSQRHPQQRPFSPIPAGSVPAPSSPLPIASPSTSQRPLTLSDVPLPPDSDAISCICGFTYDDGFSIACDDCSRWCHAACFGIVQGGEVPEFWKCWVCNPAVEVDKERAVKIQKGRLKAMRMKASHGTNGAVPGATGINGVGGNSVPEDGTGGAGKPTSRRKTSPGAERKSRRGSAVAAAIEGSGSSRKRRRASILSPANPSSPIPPTNLTSAKPPPGSTRISHPNGNGTAASSNLPPTPVNFPPDIYPNPSVYAQLLRVAKAWRGVTALNPPSPLIHPAPKTFSDGRYTRVDPQGYHDSYGYSMPPLDNTTPVLMDENAGDLFVPRTVLRTDVPPCSNLPTTCTPAHLRPPSPRLHVASDPSPFSHTSIYPSPPISNYVSTPVPSSSHPRPCAKSPLTPSTNTISSSNPNDTIPATALLAPYTAAIVPSAAYLADPLNGYAHLGMGKPQVRLVGGGWEVGLDARGIGGVPDPPDSCEKGNGVGTVKEDVSDGKARWARCGCWPNAVVRPIICNGKKGGENRRRTMRHQAKCARATSDGTCTVSEADGSSPTANSTSVPPTSWVQGQQTDDPSDQDDSPCASDSDADPTTLSFALFALRDLRADEEIVLGWEWDDGHAVHMLPALMESPGLFAPAHLHHLRAQFTSILHALSSTFTTCACGSSTRDCAVRLMERVVEGQWPWPGGEMMSEGSEGDSSDGASEERDDVEVDVEGDGHPDPPPNRKWGLGMNVDVDIEMDASIEVDGRTRRVKKRKVRKKSDGEDPTHANGGKDAGATASASSPTLKPRGRKAVDLGPLVGVKRGFRTREKAPMNGGWGGVEIVPSSLKAFPEVREEVDSNARGKGKEKARVADGTDDTDAGPLSATLPPRMRKVWSRPPTGQSEPSQENPPRNDSTRTESWRAHERWRSPPDTLVESPISIFGPVEGSSGKPSSQQPDAANMNGDGEDGTDGQETEFDTETEGDGMDDMRQMPPPPMPASLDPTTVSSLAHAHAVRSASPRGSIQWDKNGTCATRIPPQTTTPTTSWSSQPPLSSTATIARSPIPSQTNHGMLSPSTSFPSAMQVQALPHPPPSVSPSATFSKLSLHSPDASSSPHLSALYSPSEPPQLSPTSTSTQHPPDQPAFSPPHRPSKPLHVHPQNEPPLLSTSLSAPAVTLYAPDGARDTPAEAQYQQPYRSSPDTRRETEPLADVEKRRSSSGEYRVRFASPEVLCGLPRLRGRTSDGSEPDDAHGGGLAGVDAGGVEERGLVAQERDAMDVEVDVVGDDRGEDGSGASHGTSAVGDCESNDVSDGAPAPGSPPRAPSSSQPQDVSLPVENSASDYDPPPLASDVNGTTSQVDSMVVDLEPAREPSPPPPPKVKMSLKDFALRKKKQREEEMAAKALHSPGTPDGPVLPPSPGTEVKRELGSECAGLVQAVDSGEGLDVKMDDAGNANGFDGGDENERNGVGGSRRIENHVCVEGDTGTQAPSVIVATHTPRSRREPALSSPRNDTDQAQNEIDGQPTTLAAKLEIIDAVVPSGLVGVDDSAPDAVSFAPEPPPPPLTTKQANDAATMDRIGSVNSIPRSIIPASTSASTPTSTSTTAVHSRSNSVGIPNSIPIPIPLPHAHVSSSSTSIPSSRRPSHEDGEITSCTPPKTYLPRSHTPPTQPRSFSAVQSSPALGTSSSSTSTVPRRPAPPLSRSPLSNNASSAPTPAPTSSISSRPLPSGPRALRGSMSQPTHSYVPPRPPYSGSQYIPRGPSADRDRLDWERGDRPWAARAGSRGRAGSGGWGR